MSDYRVNLDIFAGPLDLLLYLVRKDEVDIYDIPISQITEQYIKYIEMLQMFDIELAGDFLVMAASLMEIKSAMLLPSVESEETQQDGEAIDPRSELVRQLLEYKKFKDAANMLRDSADERSEKFVRPDTIISKLKNTDEPELDLDQVSIWTLLETFDEIMRAVGTNYASYDNIKDDTPIDIYQIEILDRLQAEGPTTFRNIFKGAGSRLAMVGMFLAVLELIRAGLIWAEQNQQSDDIYVKALTDEPAQEAVQRAIYVIQAEEEAELERISETEEQDLKDFEEVDDDLMDSLSDEDELLDVFEDEKKINTQLRIPIKEIMPDPDKNMENTVDNQDITVNHDFESK